MIESCIAIGLICVILFGALQISNLYASREILAHAAARGARAKTVGFNQWMVRKSINVASIPNSGRMITPQFSNNDPALRSAISASQSESGRLISLWDQVIGGTLIPSSLQYEIERARIPEYLDTHNNLRSDNILNYTGWENSHVSYNIENLSPELFSVTVSQNYTNWLGLPRTFYQSDTVKLSNTNILENHYTLYINDLQW